MRKSLLCARFYLKAFDNLLIVLNCLFVFTAPFLRNFLLRRKQALRPPLVCAVRILRLKQFAFECSDPLIALVCDLIQPIVLNHSDTGQLSAHCLLFFPLLNVLLSKLAVLTEDTLVVCDVALQLLLELSDSDLLS